MVVVAAEQVEVDSVCAQALADAVPFPERVPALERRPVEAPSGVWVRVVWTPVLLRTAVRPLLIESSPPG